MTERLFDGNMMEKEIEEKKRNMKENYREIRENIAAAAKASGRKPEDITLLAATKTVPAEVINYGISLGIDYLGENKVQEFLSKYDEYDKKRCHLHFIGHLQTNKVKQVVGKVDLIQSVDSEHLLAAISREAQKQGLCQDILLEVNIGEETAKSGFAEEDILPLVDRIDSFSNIRLRGLMAIPPISRNPGDNLKFFLKMRQIYVDIRAKKNDNVSVDCLSMGMSGDFADAVAAGSTMVRIGTAIFGARDYTTAHQKM